jgi:hypothetical protein
LADHGWLHVLTIVAANHLKRSPLAHANEKVSVFQSIIRSEKNPGLLLENH